MCCTHTASLCTLFFFITHSPSCLCSFHLSLRQCIAHTPPRLSHPPSYLHNLEPSSRRRIAHMPPHSLVPYFFCFAPPILLIQPRASLGPSPRRRTVHMPPHSIASFSSFRDPCLGQWVHCPLTRTALSSVQGGVSPTHRLVQHVCSCIRRYCR